ncbi:MAG: hypothetical protein M3Y30_05095 [Gemmatimonadota bacterium]|nr:hypothetical protein [Gemmatimonadota bacterium]
MEARAALVAVDESGLSPNEFAKREGLDPQRLYSWRRKLGSSVRSQAEFVEVVRPVRPRDAWVEVVLTSGVVLRVSEAIETETLRRFVDALDGRGC